MLPEYRQTQNPTPLYIDNTEKLRAFFARWGMSTDGLIDRAHYLRMLVDARHAYGLAFATFLDRCTETDGKKVSIRPEIGTWESLFSFWARFQARHVEATYTSVWDGHIQCSARTLVDQVEKRIHATESAVTAEQADNAHSLSEEFVTFDDGTSVAVCDARIGTRREPPVRSQLSLGITPKRGVTTVS